MFHSVECVQEDVQFSVTNSILQTTKNFYFGVFYMSAVSPMLILINYLKDVLVLIGKSQIFKEFN